MPVDYKYLQTTPVVDDSHVMNIENTGVSAPSFTFNPSGDKLIDEKQEQLGVLESAWATALANSTTNAIVNALSKPNVIDPTWSDEASTQAIDFIEKAYGPMSEDQKRTVLSNVTSQEDLAWQLQIFEDQKKAQKAMEQRPVLSGIATAVAGILDPADALLSAATFGTGKLIQIGNTAFRVAANAAVGAGLGYSAGSLQDEYLAPSESSAGVYAAFGALYGGALASPKKIVIPKNTSANKTISPTGLSAKDNYAIGKFVNAVHDAQSTFDRVYRVDSKFAEDMLGASVFGRGGTGVTAEAITNVRSMSPYIVKLENSLKELDGFFLKGLRQRLNPARQAERDLLQARKDSMSRDAIAYLIEMNEHEKYIASIQNVLKELKRVSNDPKFKVSEAVEQTRVLKKSATDIQKALEQNTKLVKTAESDEIIRDIRYLVDDYNTKAMSLTSGTTTYNKIELPDFIDTPVVAPQLPADAMTQKLIKIYQDSDVGVQLGKMINSNSTLPKVLLSKNYTHLTWDSTKLMRKIDSIGKASNLAKLFGGQLAKRFDKATDEFTKEKLGALMLSSIIESSEGNSVIATYIQSIIKAEDEDLLRTLYSLSEDALPEGLDFKKIISEIVGTGRLDSTAAIGQSSLFQKRFPWDLEEELNGFRLKDFIGTDLYGQTERAVLETSHRAALSKKAFTNPITGETEFLNNGNTITVAFRNFTDKAADVYGADEAAELTKLLKAMVLGRPYGEQLSENMRSLANLAQAMHLAKSGVYNLADYANLAYDFGIKETIKAFVPTLKAQIARDLKSFTPEDAKDLADYCATVIAYDGRFKPRVNIQAEDFYRAPNGTLSESIEYATQGVRFLNGSEYIRRNQVYMAAELWQKRLERAFKGSKEDIEYMKSLGITETSFNRAKIQYTKNGFNIAKWNRRDFMEIQKFMQAAVDDCIFTIRQGERPMLMEGRLGKVVFAYQSFVFAAHNKLLRRAYNTRGALTGASALLIKQLPLSVLAAVASNLMDGKKPFENMGTAVSNSMSSLGVFSMATNALARGELGGTFPGFAPITAAIKLPGEIADGDALGITKSVPWLSVFFPLRTAVGVMSGLNEE